MNVTTKLVLERDDNSCSIKCITFVDGIECGKCIVVSVAYADKNSKEFHRKVAAIERLFSDPNGRLDLFDMD